MEKNLLLPVVWTLTYMLPVAWSLINKFLFQICYFLPCSKWKHLILLWRWVENVGSDFFWANTNLNRSSQRSCLPGLRLLVFLLKLNGSVVQKLALEYRRLRFSIFLWSGCFSLGRQAGRCGDTGKVCVCLWASLNSYKCKSKTCLTEGSEKDCTSGLEPFETENSKHCLLKYLSCKGIISFYTF